VPPPPPVQPPSGWRPSSNYCGKNPIYMPPWRPPPAVCRHMRLPPL
jgi:hypothetical protein